MLVPARNGGERIGWKISLTVIVKVSQLVKLGKPSSRTQIVTTFVLGALVSDGVQENKPVVASSVAPAGPCWRLQVSTSLGTSASVALARRLTVTRASTTLSEIDASIGAWLAGMTWKI